jgi:dTDP-4-dehydrorhamnose 3,5-epimerase
MEIIETGIEGLIELQPKVFGDSRGFFFESYRESVFKEYGIETGFVQDNESFSVKETLRGLHYQKPPFAQGKLVRVLTGKVLDVVVDIRSSSKTFGQHHKVILDAEQHNQMYVPPGFAHGFAALEDSVFSYKCTNYYNKEAEDGLLWNDTSLNLHWGIDNPIISEKDMVLPTFAELKANPSF